MCSGLRLEDVFPDQLSRRAAAEVEKDGPLEGSGVTPLTPWER